LRYAADAANGAPEKEQRTVASIRRVRASRCELRVADSVGTAGTCDAAYALHRPGIWLPTGAGIEPQPRRSRLYAGRGAELSRAVAESASNRPRRDFGFDGAASSTGDERHKNFGRYHRRPGDQNLPELGWRRLLPGDGHSSV